MTFFEAAIEVLRQAGRPLHYKKIAEFAMRDDLLSHMGKNPDATMAQRLTQEIKSQGESVIVETRPGVYGLRESEVERINEEAEQRLKREEARRKRREEAKGQEIEGDDDEEKSEDEQPKRRRNRRRSNRSKKSSGSSSSRKRSSRGNSVSEKSSDDDASEKKSSRRKSSRRKSSRRKSSRSRSSKSEPNGNKLPVDVENISDEKLDAIVNGNLITDSAPAASGGRRRARGAARRQMPKPSISKRRSTAKKSVAPVEEAAPVADVVAETPEKTSSVRESRRKRSRSRRSSKSQSTRSQSTRSQSTRSQKRSESSPQSAPASTRHLKSGPVRLDGIAQAAYTVLQDGEKRAYKIADLADEIFERKLVKFHTHDAAATVQAALANDNQIRQKRGHRPLFSLNGDAKWGLSEWGLPAAAIQKEQTILSLSEEIRQATLGDLGEALLGVKNEALEHIALTLLERLSYQNIKVSKRSSSGDVYFTADWRQGLSDVRVCIQVTLEAADELGADAVTAIRETLHHYSAAEGVIIHLGDITRDAITESRQDAKAPITLIDRKTFVELLIRHGIGVQTYTTPILMVDTEFIETLKS